MMHNTHNTKHFHFNCRAAKLKTDKLHILKTKFHEIYLHLVTNVVL